MSPNGRARGCQGHYKFLALHRAHTRSRADNKRFSTLPPRSPWNPFSHPRTQTWCWAKTALFYPTSSSPRGQNPIPFPCLRTRTGLFRESHPLGASAPFWPESEDRPWVLHTHPQARQPSARSRSGAAPGVCAARVGKLATRSSAVSGAQGGEERQAGLTTAPPGRANARETETRDKIKRRHYKADSPCRPRPRDPQAGAESPVRWGAPSRPSRTFSVHRRADGRGSERAGTACIPFSNPLSRGSLRAASCALSFASLCHSYMCACLFGGNSRGDYFLGCKRAVFISNDRHRRGEEKRRKKPTRKE